MSYAEHRRHADAVRPSVRVAVLTSSDSRTEATDESGQVLVALLSKDHEVVGRRVVPDDVAKLRRAADELLRTAQVLVVTGGTGIAPRDVAPEAFEPWFEAALPGFGERFRALSAEAVGTGAWLSRATAGVVRRRGRRALVVLLPGSPEACRLAAERLLLPELSHAVSLLEGVKPHARA